MRIGICSECGNELNCDKCFDMIFDMIFDRVIDRIFDMVTRKIQSNKVESADDL